MLLSRVNGFCPSRSPVVRPGQAALRTLLAIRHIAHKAFFSPGSFVEMPPHFIIPEMMRWDLWPWCLHVKMFDNSLRIIHNKSPLISKLNCWLFHFMYSTIRFKCSLRLFPFSSQTWRIIFWCTGEPLLLWLRTNYGSRTFEFPARKKVSSYRGCKNPECGTRGDELAEILWQKSNLFG